MGDVHSIRANPSVNPAQVRMELMQKQLADMAASLRGLAAVADEIEADVDASHRVGAGGRVVESMPY